MGKLTPPNGTGSHTAQSTAKTSLPGMSEILKMCRTSNPVGRQNQRIASETDTI